MTPGNAESPLRRARRFLRDVLAEWLIPEPRPTWREAWRTARERASR